MAGIYDTVVAKRSRVKSVSALPISRVVRGGRNELDLAMLRLVSKEGRFKGL